MKRSNTNCYIIGKGESLKYLTSSMINKGIIITINHASKIIDSLSLPNPIYSMFKDGPGKLGCNSLCNQCSQNHHIPRGATILLHKHESINCFKDTQAPKIIFDNLELGLKIFDFSAMSAIKIVQQMGCSKLYLVSFDSVTTNNCKNILGNINNIYLKQHKRLFNLLNSISHEWITPNNGEENV